MDTPVILETEQLSQTKMEMFQHESHSWTEETCPHPLPMKGPAFIIFPLRGLDHMDLFRDMSIKSGPKSLRVFVYNHPIGQAK